MTPNILKILAKRCPALVPAIFASCLEAYHPDLEFLPDGTLVVDGLLNATDRTATVKLTRTQPIYDEEHPPSVGNANVAVTSSSGVKFVLTEGQPGIYTLAGIPVTIGEKYSLSITTDDGRDFYSDPVVALATPPIDSITFGIANNKTSIDIMINSRDPSGKATYFTWDFVETYEYTSAFYSGYTFYNKIPAIRLPSEENYRCWHTIPSSSIGIVTTKELSASVLHQVPLLNIPGGSIKFSVRYSVLVKQRVVGVEEYDYLRQLKVTTEGLGGLFDPMPSVVSGNIHETDTPANRVLGYFSASEVSATRKFITFKELPKSFQISQGKGKCQVDYTCDIRLPSGGPKSCVDLDLLNDDWSLLSAAFDNGVPYSYAFVEKECADCRVRGGVTKRPDFWPK